MTTLKRSKTERFLVPISSIKAYVEPILYYFPFSGKHSIHPPRQRFSEKLNLKSSPPAPGSLSERNKQTLSHLDVWHRHFMPCIIRSNLCHLHNGARHEDEEVDVVDGGDSGGDDPGDNIFIGRQLIITASLVGS